MKNTSKKANKSNLRSLINIVIFGLLFFVFPQIEKPLVEFAQVWINNLGILAPVGYILFGVLATVVAPIGLGPINVVLQRAFGFWPSVTYFWIYETIGISINFIISTYFGSKVIKYLVYGGNDEAMKFDPITKLSTYMLNKSYFSAFVCMLGFGGEIMGYIAGLSKLNYFKFLSIIVVTNFINTLFFVGSNLTIGTNNNIYVGLQILSFIITTIPLLVFYRKEIWNYFKKIYTIYKADKYKDWLFDQQILSYKNNYKSLEEFEIDFANQVQKEIQFNIDIIFAFIPGMKNDYNMEKTDMNKLVLASLDKTYKIIKKILPQDISQQIYQKAKEDLTRENLELKHS